MPNFMAALPNIGGPQCNAAVWLTPTTRVPYSNAARGFFRLSIRALVGKIERDKVVRWCADGEFLAIFCVLYFQRAACSTFPTCTLKSH